MSNVTKIAVDPGKNGGIAVRDPNGAYGVYKMPNSVDELVKFFEAFVTNAGGEVFVLVENVGQHRAGNAASSSVTFARHVGSLEAAIVASGAELTWVRPTAWMNKVVPNRPKGANPEAVKARKNYIKQYVADNFKGIKPTLWNADALAMLDYEA